MRPRRAKVSDTVQGNGILIIIITSNIIIIIMYLMDSNNLFINIGIDRRRVPGLYFYGPFGPEGTLRSSLCTARPVDQSVLGLMVVNSEPFIRTS